MSVDDDGPGLVPADHTRLLQPFATTREGRCGLGLWAARRCAEQLGGALTLGTSELGGLRATLDLPVRSLVAGRATPQESEAATA